MKALWLLLLAFTPSVFAQSLNWPQQGYLEDWGFQRPSGCQPGDGYILQWARKFEQVYGTNPTTANAASARQNLQGGGSYAFIQAIRSKGLQSSEGRALTQLVEQLQRDESEHLRIARDYLSLRAGGGTPSSVIGSVRRFEISDNSCFRGAGGSASGSLLCGLAAKMVDHTIKLENAVQIACHAGLPTPKGGGATASTSTGSAADSANSASSANQLPPYRGPTPQSLQDCDARHNFLEKGLDVKLQLERLNMNLACRTEWQKISRLNQSTNTAANNSAQQPQQQESAQKAAAQAREAQAKGDADAQRQGRRRHDPAMEAHECIQPNFGGLYGGMVNSCPYKVNYTYCGSRPTENSWLKDIMECEKQKFGADGVGPNRESASHTKGVQSIHWFACKDPALPMDSSFEGGQIQARCRVLFAN